MSECHNIIKSLSGWAKDSFVLDSHKPYFYCLLCISITKILIENVTISYSIFWDLASLLFIEEFWMKETLLMACFRCLLNIVPQTEKGSEP